MGLFGKREKQPREVDLSSNEVSIEMVEARWEADDLVESAKDLKELIEYYGTRKKKNHRYKGRVFIEFILSNKHKNLKNTGYMHWEHINEIIQKNQTKVYPYNKENLRKAVDFFKSEVKSINSYRLYR